ncbi:peroxisomal membrane protein pex16 [Ophiocordyceps camponoti-floridani]|uniref:Peroxisomal membrane protein PEX16 n=1 Tax=Ophiocordyceps camponoti-floridani TaxID=2030778 RepID=A0A8H4Q786_9HYPO|nr:peroxisomal membrane protein pex16 [Ophiocordyceps camponoti-floridani]
MPLSRPKAQAAPRRPTAGQLLSLPSHWLALYNDFISKNAGQVSQIESALRSLTYVIPGRFRDAEVASESIHSAVQLLSLYHDRLLSRAVGRQSPAPSAHARYTRFWARKSALYRRVAVVLQMVVYSQLLCEMMGKRRGGERARWRVVVLLEAIKAVCRLLLLRATRARPLLTPALPEREQVADGDEAGQGSQSPLRSESEFMDDGVSSDVGSSIRTSRLPAHEREWTMPRTGLSLPSLPDSSDINGYLVSRVLTADDIKPAAKLLNRLHGTGHAAEVLHILAPLIYASALARSRDPRKAWSPWLLGLTVEIAARQLRDRSFYATTLERDEWNRRGWAMAWWAMRGAFYTHVSSRVVARVTRSMPAIVAGILDDYEYLWQTYYFCTSA